MASGARAVWMLIRRRRPLRLSGRPRLRVLAGVPAIGTETAASDRQFEPFGGLPGRCANREVQATFLVAQSWKVPAGQRTRLHSNEPRRPDLPLNWSLMAASSLCSLAVADASRQLGGQERRLALPGYALNAAANR